MSLFGRLALEILSVCLDPKDKNNALSVCPVSWAHIPEVTLTVMIF